MTCDRVSKIIKSTDQRQKEPGESIDQTTECMRPEQVNRWPKAIQLNDDDDDDDDFVTIGIQQQTSTHTFIVVVLNGEQCLSI